jgi:hypothetical protein
MQMGWLTNAGHFDIFNQPEQVAAGINRLLKSWVYDFDPFGSVGKEDGIYEKWIRQSVRTGSL